MPQEFFNGIDLSTLSTLDDINEDFVNRIVSSLTSAQSLSMMIKGHLFLGNLKMANWKGPASFYLFKCPTHGWQITYKSGYQKELSCVSCIREEYGLKKERVSVDADEEIKINNF